MDAPKTVVTDRADARSVLNPEIVPMPAWQIALVRTARVYLQSLAGFVTAGATGFAGAVGVPLAVGDFSTLLVQAASLAVAPAAMTLLQNAIELLASIDTKNPAFRA
jgi:hypothetical protein